MQRNPDRLADDRLGKQRFVPPSPYSSAYDMIQTKDASDASDTRSDGHTNTVKKLPKEWATVSVREVKIPMHKWRDVVTARVGVGGDLAKGKSWHGLKAKGFHTDEGKSSDEDMAGDSVSAEQDRTRLAIAAARELARHHFPKSWTRYRKRLLAYKLLHHGHGGVSSNSRLANSASSRLTQMSSRSRSRSSKDNSAELTLDTIHVRPWSDDEMTHFTKHTCATLWSMVNRRLLGRAQRTDPADEKQSQLIEQINHNGWFFADIVSYMPPLRKIVGIACGAGHVCAQTSRMNGSQLYTWGHNGHGQLGWGYKTARNPKGALTTSAIYAAMPHRVQFFSVPEDNLLSHQRANHEWSDRHRTDEGVFNARPHDGYTSNSSVHRESVVERICRVTSVCCGPSYTVCAGICARDGVTSVFSWGQVSRLSFDANRAFLNEHKKGRKVKRAAPENDIASLLGPWQAKHCRGGVPHDLERVPPQEVLRLIPAPIEGLNAQRFARCRNRDPSRVAKALLFFPLPCYMYVRNEWKRWRLDHADEVEQFHAKSSHRFKAESRFEVFASIFLRMGVRPVPCLESKERAVFMSRAKQLHTFGVSNERNAAMTRGLIADMCQLCRLNTSAWNKGSALDINVDPWVRGYIDSFSTSQALARDASTSPVLGGGAGTARTGIGSELKRLCTVPLAYFDAAAETHNGTSALAGESEQKPSGQAAETASKSADDGAWTLFLDGGKGGYTIPSDAGWTEIIARRAVCEKK